MHRNGFNRCYRGPEAQDKRETDRADFPAARDHGAAKMHSRMAAARCKPRRGCGMALSSRLVSPREATAMASKKAKPLNERQRPTSSRKK